MSSVSYELSQKGVRLVPSDSVWVKGKNGKYKLNPDYRFVGKMETSMPNIVVTASDYRKPTFKGDISELNRTAKKQIVEHFYDENGKRNKKTVAYFGVAKKGVDNEEKS